MKTYINELPEATPLDKDLLQSQINEMTIGKFSTVDDILTRSSGVLQENPFSYDSEKNQVIVETKYSEQGNLLDNIFGSDKIRNQWTKLYKDISPYELLKMCGEYYGIENSLLEKRLKEIIKRFDMKNFAHQRIDTLSTGQYQRTSIARCLVHDPKYYILDEPTSGLDVISSKVILDFIKEEKKNNKCILYSTHYMEEAENICDKIIMINKGQIIATGTPKEIKKNTKTTNLRDSFFELIGGNHE